jgi:hypothetical protein
MKNFLPAILFAFLMIGFIRDLTAAPFETQTETRTDTQVAGTLVRIKPVITGNSDENQGTGEMEYRLELDKPIVFSKGSKSERSVNDMKLVVPDGMRQQVMKLEGRHVEVQGTMNCTMYFSPWTATCNLFVRQIDQEDK